MEETRYRFWQILTTILSSIIVLTGVIITIIHFNNSQSNQFRTVEKQIDSQREENRELNLNNFQNSFWKKQLELYVKASSFAAELTQYEINSPLYIDTRKNFYTLFWGPMSIVEDQKVKSAMKAFSDRLIIYEKNKTSKELDTLQQKSFQLARTCRESSIKRWDLKEFELE